MLGETALSTRNSSTTQGSTAFNVFVGSTILTIITSIALIIIMKYANPLTNAANFAAIGGNALFYPVMIVWVASLAAFIVSSLVLIFKRDEPVELLVETEENPENHGNPGYSHRGAISGESIQQKTPVHVEVNTRKGKEKEEREKKAD